MTDQAVVTGALHKAALILGDYFDEPGVQKNPVATIKRLISVLDDPEVAVAIKRLDGLRVVK